MNCEVYGFMANDSTFIPKKFYRKFDALLNRIGRGASMKELLLLVLDELVVSFGGYLDIKSGCLYRLKGESYQQMKAPLGDIEEKWPSSFSRNNMAVSLLHQHKSFIFHDSPEPPWGFNSVALVFGENDESLMAFRLRKGWDRETLEFSLNTIRSTVNYSSSTRRFTADLEEAYEIQRSLLPMRDPIFEGFEIAGRSVAAELVGGDLYDYQLLDERVLGLAVGDASGHGLPAALLARDVITGLRMGMEKEMKISGVINKLNHVINMSALSTRFISLVYGELERNGTIVYVNAGHPPPLLFKESEIVRLDIGGTILGPIKDATFKRGFAFLDPGDVLVMFSDGIIEHIDQEGNMIGMQGLIDFIWSVKDKNAPAILEALFDHLLVCEAGTERRDDATAVIVKRTA